MLLTEPQRAESRAPVAGDTLQVDSGFASSGKHAEKSCLADTGHAVENNQLAVRYEVFEEGGDLVAERLVAADKLFHRISGQIQDRGHSLAPQAAAPAVDEDRATSGNSGDFVHHLRESSGCQLQSPDPGKVGPLLLVERADLYSLFIHEKRDVDSSGEVIFGKFERRTDVDDAVGVEQVRVEGYGFRHSKVSLRELIIDGDGNCGKQLDFTLLKCYKKMYLQA